MKYNEATEILRRFASEPLDVNSLNINKVTELRRALRNHFMILEKYQPTLTKLLDSNDDALIVELRLAESNKRNNPKVYAEPTEESIPIRMVDLIRESTDLKGYATEMELYKPFRKSLSQMKTIIGKSYGIVTMSKGKGEDGYDEYRFHFLADNGLEFNEKYDGKAPKGHTIIGPGW